jgi:hypothetical protein
MGRKLGRYLKKGDGWLKRGMGGYVDRAPACYGSILKQRSGQLNRKNIQKI